MRPCGGRPRSRACTKISTPEFMTRWTRRPPIVPGEIRWPR
jgi:hypothetical protein